MMNAEVEFYARVDAAEVVARWIERMAAAHGDESPAEWDYDALHALRAEAFGHGPEPPTPAAPNVVHFRFRPRRFDRVAHCQTIAAGGGLATFAKYGRAHYSALGKAGRAATVAAHGEGYWRGLRAVKRWRAAPRPSPALDRAVGEYLADAA